MATHRRGTSGAQWLVADLLRREGRAWPSLSPAARGLAVGGALLCSTVVAVSMAAEPRPPSRRHRPNPSPRSWPPRRPPPARLAHLAGGAAHPLARNGATRRGSPATARTAHGAPVAVAHGAGPDRRAERAGRRRRPRVDGAPARDGPARCGRRIVRRLDGPRDGQRQAPGRSPRGSRPGRRVRRPGLERQPQRSTHGPRSGHLRPIRRRPLRRGRGPRRQRPRRPGSRGRRPRGPGSRDARTGTTRTGITRTGITRTGITRTGTTRTGTTRTGITTTGITRTVITRTGTTRTGTTGTGTTVTGAATTRTATTTATTTDHAITPITTASTPITTATTVTATTATPAREGGTAPTPPDRGAVAARDQGRTSPSRTAHSAACVLDVSSSLVSTLPRCVCTVRSPMDSARPMSRFDRPSATSTSTSRSRAVMRRQPRRGRDARRAGQHPGHGGVEVHLTTVCGPDRLDDLVARSRP